LTRFVQALLGLSGKCAAILPPAGEPARKEADAMHRPKIPNSNPPSVPRVRLVSERKTYYLQEFCEAYSISRSQVYKLWEEGKGPLCARMGKRRVISVEAARAWFRKLEEEAAKEGKS
jgi:predicted DNA-binding transcriptional regulator AlpA